MATKTLLTVPEYATLEEPEGVRYELSEGELIVTPSPSLFHNDLRDELNGRLRAFAKRHNLGRVTSETDMKLVGEVVRRPDVAFIQSRRLQDVDDDQSPLPVSPDLAVEIVSKSEIGLTTCLQKYHSTSTRGREPYGSYTLISDSPIAMFPATPPPKCAPQKLATDLKSPNYCLDFPFPWLRFSAERSNRDTC